jgi:hypothetical protein
MTVRASVINTDVILQFTDHSAEPFFSGLELERRTDTADWSVWTGAAWVQGGIPAALVSNRFSDYSLAAAIYQYRYRVKYEETPGFPTYSSYAESDWVRIASSTSERRGWMFGNYAPPDGQFGEILTSDDIRYTFLWGVPFTSSAGDVFTDAQVRAKIESAVAELERALNFTMVRRVVKCRDNLAPGAEYDVLEDAYTYHRHLWNAGGRLNVLRRPIISVERFELYTITQQRVMDLMPWLRIDYEKGVLRFYPRAGADSSMRVSPTFLAYGYYSNAKDYAHAYQLDYTAGLADASKVPADLREIVGKIAACKLLNIIGDGLIAGFSSMSLGLDGLSESFSTTQSATNAFYGARIGIYLKDIENYLKENRYKFGGRPMGAI